MIRIKEFLKNIVPEDIFLAYYYLFSLLTAAWFGFPSRKMVVIGVTGTKGKTSTAFFIWSLLMAGGYKTGMITTARIHIGEKEIVNNLHMTMPGRTALHKYMAEMVEAGCSYCVVETTSEGLKQCRNIGVFYDIGIFTNLTPEHLSSHGGDFEEYKEAKGKMFDYMTKGPVKMLEGKRVPKVIIANADSPHADYYLSFPADEKVTYGLSEKADVMATGVISKLDGVRFAINGHPFALGVHGAFNVMNALPAMIVAGEVGMSQEAIVQGLAAITLIPGRMQLVDVGQSFTVIVDYAHEKASMTAALGAANDMKVRGTKSIVVLGAEGGGRDKAKRREMGEVAATLADIVIATTTDPYEEDPKEIAEEIVSATLKHSQDKVRDQNVFVIVDRRQAIRKAFSLAGKGDVVLLTGMGAQESMVVKGRFVPWNNPKVANEELLRIKKTAPSKGAVRIPTISTD